MNPVITLAMMASLASAPTIPSAPSSLASVPSAVGYTPQDKEERGLWMQVDEAERELKTSRFVIDDPALNAYVRSVLCRAVGTDRCDVARVYLIRTADFNANMAPNGMMQVWSGLLLRMNNEAELAAVLAHEFAHFERRHSLQSLRDIRKKTDAMTWFSFVPYIGLAGQLALIGSVFSFSREMEREADTQSIAFMARSGYDPVAAANIWRQLRDEQDATALARKTRSRKDRNGGFFATHPNTAERMTYLTTEAAQADTKSRFLGAAEYRAALAAWWPRLIDDQVKLNDFGGTQFLLAQRERDAATPELAYARGELLRARGASADFAVAASAYREAVAARPDFAEGWRGLGLAQLRAGEVLAGRTSLQTYLRLRPAAADQAMIALLANGN